jgi:TATA-box binding protein (TBP) (component of TFIID and TFIIIB)
MNDALDVVFFKHKHNDMKFITSYRDFTENGPVYQFPPGVLNVVNMVCTFKFGKSIDLNKLLDRCPFVCVKRFVTVKLRIYPPRTTLSVFSKGSAIDIGAKNQFIARDSAEIFLYILRKTLDDDELKICKFTYHNYTATAKLPFEIDLQRLSKHPRVFKAKYFPTYNIRLKGTRINCGCSEDNIIITGAKSERGCEEAYRLYRKFLLNYRCETGEENKQFRKKQKIDMPSLDMFTFE